MKKELFESFNAEVERYRKALLFYAKKSEWDTFKTKAGSLFDYIESIEISETERRFFRLFRAVFACLAIVVLVIYRIDFQASAELLRLKTPALLFAASIGCFELYFYLNFRLYMESKTKYYRKRRERFIVNIESDFREIAFR